MAQAEWQEKVVIRDGTVIGDKCPDPYLGEYVGTLTTASNTSAGVEAEVFPTRSGHSVVLIVMPSADERDPTRTVIDGIVAGNALVFSNETWFGSIVSNSLTAREPLEPSGRIKLSRHVRVPPSLGSEPPEGAILLLPFAPGSKPSLGEWSNRSWTPMEDGSMQVGRGDIRTKRSFASFKVHVEFMCPYMPKSAGQGRGNSGVYLHDRYEVQVLDSFGLVSKDNDCGGVYKVAAPRENACLPPCNWQTYDITFQAPQVGPDGTKIRNARVRVVHNGMAIHDNLEIPGATGGARGKEGPTGALRFQDHGNKVRYRNVWLVELGDAGAQDVKQLARALSVRGSDVMAEYTLHGMALHAAASGKDAEREKLAEELIRELEAGHPLEARKFLVRQLQLVDVGRSATVLGKLAAGKELGEPATQALVAIGGDVAAAALRGALERAHPSEQLRLVQALGLLRDAGAVAPLTKLLHSDTPGVRLAVLESLGSIGDPAAVAALYKAAAGGNAYERSIATASTLRMAENLLAAGKQDAAAALYRQLWDSRTGEKERHIRCASLYGLATALDVEAMDYVVAAMGSPDPQIRGAAVEAGVAMPSREATLRWIRQFETAPAKAKAEIISLLGRRGDSAAFPTVLGALDHKAGPVRLAAIPVAAGLGKAQAVRHLLPFLGQEGRPASAAMTALRGIPGKETTQILSDAMPSASSAIRAGILRILAMRGTKENLEAILAFAGDTDGAVRTGVLKALGVLGDEGTVPHVVKLLRQSRGDAEARLAEDTLVQISSRVSARDKALPVLAEYDDASVAVKRSLLRVFGRIGTDRALKALLKAVKDKHADIQDTAVRVLSGHPDERAADYLYEIARETPNLKHHVFALRGYIRLSGVAGADEGRAARLGRALKTARRTAEKKEALSALRGNRSVESLRLVTKHMDDGPIAEEACAAAVAIVQGMQVGGYRQSKAITVAMEKVEFLSTNDRLIGAARDCLIRHKKPELPDINIARD